MGRIATTVDEQLDLLRNRGMNLDEPEVKIKEILLDIGYYRLGFYWSPFTVNRDHNFKQGTKFSDVIKLYYFDVDLRNLLLKYLKRIEINFRTKVIYHVSNKYPDSPAWFVDPNVMKKSSIDSFPKLYIKKFKNSNQPIKNHHKKYVNDKYAPAWKTLEFMTFGAINNIFQSLKDLPLRRGIASQYDINSISKFNSLMDTLVFLRNSCAHSGVIFDLRKAEGIKSCTGLNYVNNDQYSLGTMMDVLRIILSKVSKNREAEFIQELTQICDNALENNELGTILVTNNVVQR